MTEQDHPETLTPDIVRIVHEAEEKGREQGRLEGAQIVGRTITHDLNNALVPIVGFADLLASDPQIAVDPNLSSCVRYIQAAAENITARLRRYGQIVRLVRDPATSLLDPKFSTLDMERSTQPFSPQNPTSGHK